MGFLTVKEKVLIFHGENGIRITCPGRLDFFSRNDYLGGAGNLAKEDARADAPRLATGCFTD